MEAGGGGGEPEARGVCGSEINMLHADSQTLTLGTVREKGEE